MNDVLEGTPWQEFTGLKIRNVEVGNVNKDVETPVCAITFKSDENYFNGANIKVILKGKYAKDVYLNYLGTGDLYKDIEYKGNGYKRIDDLSVNILAEFREVRKNEIIFDKVKAIGFIDTNIYVVD